MKIDEANAVAAAINATVAFVAPNDQELAALRAADALNNSALGARFRVKDDKPFELVANADARFFG